MHEDMFEAKYRTASESSVTAPSRGTGCFWMYSPLSKFGFPSDEAFSFTSIGVPALESTITLNRMFLCSYAIAAVTASSNVALCWQHWPHTPLVLDPETGAICLGWRPLVQCTMGTFVVVEPAELVAQSL